MGSYCISLLPRRDGRTSQTLVNGWFYKADVSPCILTYRGLHCGLLHPLDGLPVVDDPDVLPLDHLVQELAEGLAVLLVLEPSWDQIGVTNMTIVTRCCYMLPGGVEVESEGGAVGVVVSVEVGHEDVVELLLREVGRAGVDHGAAVLLEHQLVQRHLPYPGERPAKNDGTREHLPTG